MQITLIVRTFILSLALFAMSTITTHATEELPWLVDSVSGGVFVRQIDNAGKGESKPVMTGAILWAPFEILTGQDGKTRLQRGADRIDVSPNSVIELGADITDADGVLSRVRQMLGIALFNVDKIPKRGFEVETPFLVSVVKGTTFTVRVGASAAGVSLSEGSLLVLNGKREDGVLIVPGQTAYTDPSDSLIHVSDTAKLDSRYEHMMSPVTTQGRGGDSGVADVYSWSLMDSAYAPINTTVDGVPVDASQLVGGVLQTVSGLTGAVDSTTQALSGALGDTAVGGTVAGLDAGVGQLLGSGSVGGQLGSGQGLIEGVVPSGILPPLQLPITFP